MLRSLNAPGSPSAPLTTTALGRSDERLRATVRHLRPVGKPASAAAAQARVVERGEYRLRLDRAGIGERGTATGSQVGLEVADRSPCQDAVDVDGAGGWGHVLIVGARALNRT